MRRSAERMPSYAEARKFPATKGFTLRASANTLGGAQPLARKSYRRDAERLGSSAAR